MSLEVQLSQLPLFHNKIDIIQQTADKSSKILKRLDMKLHFREKKNRHTKNYSTKFFH